MRTKHLCVLIHIRIKGEVGTVKHVLALHLLVFTDRSNAVLLLWIDLLYMFHVCCYYVVLSIPYLLGKSWPLGSLVCDVFLCFVTFLYGVSGRMWYLVVSIPDICPLYFVVKASIQNKYTLSFMYIFNCQMSHLNGMNTDKVLQSFG